MIAKNMGPNSCFRAILTTENEHQMVNWQVLKLKYFRTLMQKKLYIETVGCQMNMLDSEMVVASLRKKGYELTDSTDEADTILFNTCSVREHAEHKIYSALGRLRKHKKENPKKVIGVLGCMAQKDQKLIFEKAPYVDIVVGPGQLQQVPEMIEKAKRSPGQYTALSLGAKKWFG